MGVTLQFDSATGSDTASSGSGPAIARSVSDASTSSDGLTATVPNMDLSGIVAEHVIYIPGDGFREIVSVADSGTPTASVVVAVAFTADLTSQTAIIGGKLATLFGVHKPDLQSSIQGGWTLSFASGHQEFYPTTQILTLINNNFAGNPVKFVGEPGTQPYFEVDRPSFGDGFNLSNNDYCIYENLRFHNIRSGGAADSRKTLMLGVGCILRRCKVSALRIFSTTAVLSTESNRDCVVVDCDVWTDNSSNGTGVAGRGVSVYGSRIWGVDTGINLNVFSTYGAVFVDNHIDARITGLLLSTDFNYPSTISGNLVSVGSGGVGIELVDTRYNGHYAIERNVITGGGAGAVAIDVVGTEAATHKFFSTKNAIHDMVNQLSDNQKLFADNTDDPQLSGHPSTGGYSIGNQTVADFLLPEGVSVGGGGGGGTTVIVVDD